jgi:hypothetical protein
MNNVICLLTKEPNIIWLNFLNSFTNYKIYIIIDDNTIDYKNMYGTNYPNIIFVQIDNSECIKNGYTNLNIMFKSNVTSWEKSIYYFTNIENNYDNVWFIEDDVFFRFEDTLTNIDKKYLDGDLLSNQLGINETGKKNIWHWNKIKINNKPPYYNAMMCICRISKKLLNFIKIYVKKNNRFYFLEAMFPTICKQNNLINYEPSEFYNITWRNTFDFKDFNENNLYHPVKDINYHIFIRSNLFYT